MTQDVVSEGGKLLTSVKKMCETPFLTHLQSAVNRASCMTMFGILVTRGAKCTCDTTGHR